MDLKMKQPLSLNTHNVMDYVIGVSLISAPYLFRFNNVPKARNVFLSLGGGLIGYSLATDYKYSIAKKIPVSTHMKMDLASGATVIAAPYLLGYANRIGKIQHMVHWVFGLGAMALVGLTRGNQVSLGSIRNVFKLDNIRKVFSLDGIRNVFRNESPVASLEVKNSLQEHFASDIKDAQAV